MSLCDSRTAHPYQHLERLRGRSVVSVSDLEPAEVAGLLRLAAGLQHGGVPVRRPLRDLIVLTAFFEPSTRTRLSFESAALRLGAGTISIPDGKVTGAGKGESLADMGRMFDSYADLVVLRHPDAGAVEDIRGSGMTLPLINAGNGCAEHPTQALADWFALTKRIAGRAPGRRSPLLHIGVIGTPRLMRTVRSFLLLGARCFASCIGRVTVVSEDCDPVGPEVRRALDDIGVPLRVEQDLARCVGSFDVVYINSLAPVDGVHEPVNTGYALDASTPLKDEAVILHPLARTSELATSLDGTAHNGYFDQAAGAVVVRQSLLLAVTGRLPVRAA